MNDRYIEVTVRLSVGEWENENYARIFADRWVRHKLETALIDNPWPIVEVTVSNSRIVTPGAQLIS